MASAVAHESSYCAYWPVFFVYLPPSSEHMLWMDRLIHLSRQLHLFVVLVGKCAVLAM